ncbi:hypothetical protein LN426_02955 [Pseudomonas syringae]|nr:hypothetical protein [Pseudomonas syringae]MDC6487634.1 hypothetical protein [Pseudomonas syringae]MDC6492561.1 hypothetical protein [Pseudomonas syringae]MDC6497509.1 hypothetical protein [Pseudomonas syringae]MDC6508063.1 hypothetical protein [Pseudomonas syringae]MDC6524034.1 hypothetical protein [Pseudomonas syringae]
MTELNAMFGARYHVALVGKSMVSNFIISPVSLGFNVVHECFSEHGIFSMESITLWLAEKRGESANSIDVESLMMEFWRLQVAIGMKMGTIVKVHK